MPYVVLARKWRPRLFDEVVGQEHVTRTLQNAIAADRVAHAYLFAGPRGVGKTTVARILAKAVNCRERTDTEPCGECDICREISSGVSIDVIEIDAASNRRIEEMREIRENVKFTPVLARYKVYIIDEAHMLTTEAFNAFLKTLEEPPEHIIFILATTEPHKIPATILSRCQRFDFRMLTHNEIFHRLKHLVEAEGVSVDDEALSLIADSADGALRDAESILDQLLSFGGEELKLDDVSKLLGLGAYKLLGQLVENILQSDSAESLKTLNTLAEHGADLNQLLKKLVSHFRDLMVYGINPDLIDASETRRQQLARQAEGVSTERLMKIARILAQTESDIKQLGYERLNLEMALVKLSRLREDDIPLDKVLGKLEEIESKFTPGAVHAASMVTEPEPVYDEAAASIEEEELDEYDESDPLKATWSKLLKAVKENHSPMLHAFLIEASPVSMDDDSLTIGFASKFDLHREHVQETDNREAIETQLSEIMSRQMKLKINAPNNSEDSGEEMTPSQVDMRHEVQQDESVKRVMEVFNGRVIDVKK